jgi:hypothetical protein
MAQWKKGEGYWDYSIDHIAKYDIHAFLSKIFKIKVEEFKRMEECSQLT